MKKAVKIGVLSILVIVLAISYGRFTYWMQEKYEMEWLWTIVRLLPLLFVIYVISIKKKR